ncbi:hypothetical protein E2320_013940, partial [Naja naja]
LSALPSSCHPQSGCPLNWRQSPGQPAIHPTHPFFARSPKVFTFEVGNHPGVLNPSPAVEMVQVTFICAHPASMAVTPVYKLAAGAPPCPLPQHHKQLVPVSSLRNTVLELVLFDQHRRKFDNFSSLILEWTSANESLARFTHPRSMQMVDKDDGTGQTRLHGHQLLEVHQIKGTVLIAVNFVKYSERAVELLLVEDVTVVPDNVTMYNHPDVKEVFALVEGSGYFLINSSTQDMANITYLETESAIQVVPVLPGSLALEVYDLCLAFLGPATAYLRVSNMYELEVDLIDKVEIGKSVLVSVRVLGSHRSAFRSKYFTYMHLQLKAASPIVSLTLFPEKMTLIPRNMLQVMSEGGPQPQSLIHFSISNRSVAEVNGLGQVSAKAVGTAFILGTIRAINEDTGKVIVFSQVHVSRTSAAGRTSLRVVVRTSDAEAGQFEGNVTELSDEVQILILQCFPNSSVIEEDGHGLLKAGAVTGTAVLEVSSLELFGANQTVITGVRVAPVSYLEFSSTPKLYTATRAPLPAFPLGMALTLTVRFFDSAGNYTYTAQAVNQGVTLVGVWDERHPGMADYISVPVEHAIGPDLSAPLAVGDVVCFSTPLISPGDVLEMDVVSGATFAKHPGKATVFHEIPGILICQLDFNPNILDIPASKIFHIRPAFYPDKGLYACLVTVKAHPEEDLLALSTAEGFMDVSAALRSEQSPEPQRVTVPFFPAFFLNQSEIVLSSSQTTSEILVLGARRAHPTSPVVQVDAPLLLPDMPGLVLFPIRVVNLTSLHRRAAPVFVNLSCSLTGQRAAVLVRPEQEQPIGFDLCAEASLVRQLVGSYQVLLFTVFAVLASTMTVPVVYIPSASTQDGYLYPPLSAQHQPSSLRNRTQAWLWSIPKGPNRIPQREAGGDNNTQPTKKTKTKIVFISKPPPVATQALKNNSTRSPQLHCIIYSHRCPRGTQGRSQQLFPMLPTHPMPNVHCFNRHTWGERFPLTFCQPCLSTSGLAQHGRAADAQHNRLGVTENRGDFVATWSRKAKQIFSVLRAGGFLCVLSQPRNPQVSSLAIPSLFYATFENKIGLDYSRVLLHAPATCKRLCHE